MQQGCLVVDMGEVLDLLKKKYTKPKQGQSVMRQMGISNKINSICSKYLRDAEDVLHFEVIGDDLAYAVIVIDEEPLVNKYQIVQISETIFEARLRRVEF